MIKMLAGKLDEVMSNVIFALKYKFLKFEKADGL